MTSRQAGSSAPLGASAAARVWHRCTGRETTHTTSLCPPAGVFGDWLSRLGARGWLTAGSCIAAAPLIALSLLAPDYKQSFAALLVGFALR